MKTKNILVVAVLLIAIVCVSFIPYGSNAKTDKGNG